MTYSSACLLYTSDIRGMGLVCSSLPALAMEAWNNQQGGNKYQVIFDGKIYENAWWVSSTDVYKRQVQLQAGKV